MLPYSVRISGNFQSLPGPGVQAGVLYTGTQMAPALGRPFSAGPNGQKTVNIYDPNTTFSDRLNQLDIRFSKIFHIGTRHVRRQLRHLQFLQLGRAAGPDDRLFRRERRHVAAAHVGHPGPDHQVRLQVGFLAVESGHAGPSGRRALLMRHLAVALLAALLAAPAAAQPDAIVPFKIQVPNAVLNDLKQRLGQARFPDELSGAGWNYGTDLAYLRQLTAYWRDRYDWRAQERRLNELPQFKTRIDGLDIHFVHWRSSVPGAMPIVMIHGWPGSFLEFVKISDLLVNPGPPRRTRRRRVSRGGRVAPGLRVLGQAARAGLLARADGRRRRDADEASGLRALRRPGRRLGIGRRPDGGAQRRAARGRPAPQFLHGRRAAGNRQPERRRAAGPAGAGPRTSGRDAERAGVLSGAVDQAADAGLRPERFAGRASPRGSSRSSARGATAAATWSGSSRRTSS